MVTILFGNELVNISLSIVGAAIVGRILQEGVEAQTLVAVTVITPILLVAGEITPKNISLRFARHLSPVIIWPLQLFSRIISPLRYVLTRIADLTVFAFGGRRTSSEPMVMEEEFLRLVDLSRKEGAIIEEERKLIHKVFAFTDKVAADIMTPAGRVFALSVDLAYAQMVDEIKKTKFSRIPFHKGERSNIVGILHVRDLFGFHRKRLAGEASELSDILRPPLFVGPKTPLEELLGEFRRTQLHMAIVRDDSGRLLGVATMDDVLEELFGEIEETNSKLK